MRQLLENLQHRWISDHYDLTSNENGTKYIESAAHSAHHFQHLKSFQFASQSGHPSHVQQGHISLDKLSTIIKHLYIILYQ